jgi:hypothetical protein
MQTDRQVAPTHSAMFDRQIVFVAIMIAVLE